MAGVASDPDAGPMASGYHMLLENLENAMGDAKGKAKEKLANVGLLVGVDITPPAVEFTAAGPKDEATALGDGWVLHVTDGGSGLLAEPIDASIEVRNVDGTEDVEEAKDAAAAVTDEFTIDANETQTRFTIEVNPNKVEGETPAVGYYTFAATATDRAGNETDSGSRVALNDVTRPDPIRLFVVPGADAFTYDKTLLASDNLSIAGYQVNLVLPPAGIPGENLLEAPEIMLGAETVDAYDASPLKPELLVQGPVTFPYLALQSGSER